MLAPMLVLPFDISRRRRSSRAGTEDFDLPIVGDFTVKFNGSAAVVTVTDHSLWVVPTDHDRSAMVAPAISSIRAVELRAARRWVVVVVTTAVGSIELQARGRVARRIASILATHPDFRGVPPSR